MREVTESEIIGNKQKVTHIMMTSAAEYCRVGMSFVWQARTANSSPCCSRCALRPFWGRGRLRWTTGIGGNDSTEGAWCYLRVLR